MIALLVFAGIVMTLSLLFYSHQARVRHAELLDKTADVFGLRRRPNESNASLRFRIANAVAERRRKDCKYEV